MKIVRTQIKGMMGELRESRGFNVDHAVLILRVFSARLRNPDYFLTVVERRRLGASFRLTSSTEKA
jgi:hypothetical protein